MQYLEPYKNYFDQAYPDYGDNNYSQIVQLLQNLPSDHVVADILGSDQANLIFQLLAPLIRIKNYKSQIPFPVEVYAAAQMVASIRNSQPEADLSAEHKGCFKQMLQLEGFQLPTVSAVFHFCYPDWYPIVDRNIAAACGLLRIGFPYELTETLPPLPAGATSSSNKLQKYQKFIVFLNRIKTVHNAEYETNYSFRDLDKALMVYGVREFREHVERG